MAIESLYRFEDFGFRSLLTHGLMAVAFVGAIVSALVVEGQVGLVSFVAFLNFTAGLWVAHSIHSLGNAASGDDYEGILKVIGTYVG